MTATTLDQLTATIREVNTANGWFEDDREFGDDVALLHSEVSEALEAYRDHGYVDNTIHLCKRRTANGWHDQETHLCKPEGVGSELADVVIRLLDTVDRNGLEFWHVDESIADVRPATVVGSFGTQLAMIHLAIAQQRWLSVLQHVVGAARMADVDLDAELDRKIRFNRTRGHKHGGKRL